MAGDHRQPSPAMNIYEDIRARPYRFGFLLTLRRLDCVHRQHPRTGDAVRASDEAFRLGQHAGLEFAPATMQSCEPLGESGRWILRSRFLGLFGPNGPLPLHLTEYARDRIRRQHDDTFTSFVDIFHHRLLALFYSCWSSGQPTVQLDRPESDRFSFFVGSLIGLGTEAFRQRDAMPDEAKFYFASRLAGQPRNREGLEAILVHYFGKPCRVEQFLGHWMRLPEDCLTRLGGNRDSAVLGRWATCGQRVWDTQSKFRLLIGPLDFSEFCRLLPGTPSLARLVALVRNYTGDEWLWDIRLILRRQSIPATQLGAQGRLGWTSFLISRPPPEDSDAAVFTPEY